MLLHSHGWSISDYDNIFLVFSITPLKMTFFDPLHPNKYKELKKLLVPYQLTEPYCSKPLDFKRMGKKDGSYVVPDIKQSDAAILSYGIGDDPEGVSFEQAFDEYNCCIHMYDGSIDEAPSVWTGKNSRFFKEYLSAENFSDHLELFKKDAWNATKFILKMDIEGHEYDVLTDKNLKLINSFFDVICIEVHSLIEEVPAGWDVEPQLLEAKLCPEKVVEFFRKLNENWNLWHMHGNNHSPCYVDLPDSLELTYIKKVNCSSRNGVREERFPIEGLDEPNYDGRPDYVLDWWI